MHNLQSPRTDDTGIEAEIQAKGKTAARVLPVDLEREIVTEHYFTALDGVRGHYDGIDRDTITSQRALELLTFCVLVLRNGFTVTGESACASPENFDAEIGRKIARTNAVNKVWPLLGYELKSRLARELRFAAMNPAELTELRADFAGVAALAIDVALEP